MQKLNKNRKGLIIGSLVLYLAGATVVFGHIKYKAGEWGANGTQAVHIDRESLWFNNLK